ncbi:DUF433 domain-containing protein [Nocardiopsis metallicus]|uniref:Uncharacterized protein (DUF433 family) n=1 Tax=Nocardiopsis metallicus TaxID=179819 RepID=A0A840WAZ3_9ACTN|nr:DUF433 domain-containing protein [Nocardiopsis metallicus]MBB5494169.1 uncharacterized protein (DUF433 family) [Nocardiopsis metallicus]
MDDIRFTMGVLNVSDAARYLGTPRSTLKNWVGGGDGEPGLVHALPPEPSRLTATMPFIALAEVHVLRALRRAGVRPRRIRPALERLRQEFGEYALVARELATDGVDVLWDFSRTSQGEGIIEGVTGQHVMREIIQDYLRYVVWEDDEYPERLRLMVSEPHAVVIDPHRFFGQPFFADSGVRVADVAGMLRADESPEVVADEFGITVDSVRTAARLALGQAA